MSKWEAGEFSVPVALTKDIDPSTAEKVRVAGWIGPVFALDFRVFPDSWDEDYEKGWCLTHIATGFAAGAFICPLQEAMDLADALEELADWSFTDVAQAKSLGPIVSEFRASTEGKYKHRSAAFSPFWGAEQ